jgi:hypothetical protein
MTLFVGIDIENLYTQVKLPNTITKYNVDTGEPYSIDAGLYKFTVGDLTFETNNIKNYDWESIGLNILTVRKNYYNCRKHKSQHDYFIGNFINKIEHYTEGSTIFDEVNVTLFKDIEILIQFTKEKLQVITSKPNIVVLHKKDPATNFHEGVPC